MCVCVCVCVCVYVCVRCVCVPCVFADVPDRVPEQQRAALQRGSHHAGDAVQRRGGALQGARRGRLLPGPGVERLRSVSPQKTSAKDHQIYVVHKHFYFPPTMSSRVKNTFFDDFFAMFLSFFFNV